MLIKETLRKKFSVITKQSSKDNDYTITDNASILIKKYNPKVIGLYLAMEHEIDLLCICLKHLNIVYTAPKLIFHPNEQMVFVNYYPGSRLEQNEHYFSFLEPISDNIMEPNIIFVPGLAFDLKGYRLGRGKGHYDKYLANHNAIKIGICRNENLTTNLPKEPHDIKMDYIITENIILTL